MNYQEESLKLHENMRGKLEIRSKVLINSRDDLSLVYTPGVAEPCRHIAKNKEDVYKYTIKGNCVAVISDGTAVLGLGDIGAEAGIPVMEGKSVLFKEFANIDAFPICLASKDVKNNIDPLKIISPVFSGINPEDLKAPECFVIELALQDLGIPVMHDDQHGTAVVVLAALLNALKVVNKNLYDIRITISGAGAAGTAVTKLLIKKGVNPEKIVLCDTKGIIYAGRDNLNDFKKELALLTNVNLIKGTLRDAMKGSDVFIGISTKNLVDKEMIKSMAKDSIVIAMANPDPEILPNDAKEAGARIVATGRSDFPNQVNNVLVFPGIFRGALDVRATMITTEMKIAAAEALASIIKKPTEECILPYALDKSVVPKVAEAVKNAWLKYVSHKS